PDLARTITTYADHDTARRETRRVLTLDEAMNIRLFEIRADCAEGSDDRLADGPVERCSVISACRLSAQLTAELKIKPFVALPIHDMDSSMRG
ncbi:hypothetical protein ABTJ99_19545, partial [Acinetobacter baumannii]